MLMALTASTMFHSGQLLRISLRQSSMFEAGQRRSKSINECPRLYLSISYGILFFNFCWLCYSTRSVTDLLSFVLDISLFKSFQFCFITICAIVPSSNQFVVICFVTSQSLLSTFHLLTFVIFSLVGSFSF